MDFIPPDSLSCRRCYSLFSRTLPENYPSRLIQEGFSRRAAERISYSPREAKGKAWRTQAALLA
jgi:hypothetical protein